MELKPVMQNYFQYQSFHFNRTNMELKRYRLRQKD